jgi:hypothetical protein
MTKHLAVKHLPVLMLAAGLTGCLTAAALAAEPADLRSMAAIGGPPAGFDALRATDAELAAFALPPRPDARTAPDAYAKWVHAMSIHTTRMLAPLQVTTIYHGPARGTGTRRTDAAVGTIGNIATYTSSNWSGDVNLNKLTKYNASTSFYYILSDFVVPVVKNASCDGTYDYSSQWDGIDGWGSGDVLQAGTEADAYCSGGSTGLYYAAWIEWYPYSESRISGFTVNPGDDMFVEVWNTSSTVGYAYLENLSTGQTAEYELTPPSGTQLIGNSAEWIVERPEVGGALATLADYTLDYHSSGAAYSFKGTQYLPGSTSSFLVDMYNGSTELSAASLLGTGAVEYIYQ